MKKRRSWIEALAHAWRRRSVVWLSGVRRAGETTLSQSLPGVEYFDCELPRARRELADPEAFLAAFRQAHPRGESFVVSRDLQRPYRRNVAGVNTQFVSLDGLIERLGRVARDARMQPE